MKKTALYVQNEASKRFNPYVLSSYLTHTDTGIAIVDRKALITNQDDERLFYVVLNKDYGWAYRCPETSTVYFMEENGMIYGGVFDYEQGIQTQRLVAINRAMAKKYNIYNHLYVYDDATLSSIAQSIHS